MRLVGSKVPRFEDRRVLTGRGAYVDDVVLPGMLHTAFLRSAVAHARVESVDVDEARQAPGVVAVFTGRDMQALAGPMPMKMAGAEVPVFYPLATDRVRYVGDPVALVVAKTRRQAEDALEIIEVSHDHLPPVLTYEQALDPQQGRLFDDLDSNIVATNSVCIGDIDQVFAGADRVVERTLSQHRLAPVPMEMRGIVADFNPATDDLIVHANVQAPHALRMALADVLSITLDRIRVVVPDVGGSFGLKSTLGPENFAVAVAAKHLGARVKWTEDRYEHMLSAGQAREEKAEIAVAVSNEGDLLGLRVRLVVDQGAYPAVPFPGRRR